MLPPGEKSAWKALLTMKLAGANALTYFVNEERSLCQWGMVCRVLSAAVLHVVSGVPAHTPS
jgi:hypothetical protein